MEPKYWETTCLSMLLYTRDSRVKDNHIFILRSLSLSLSLWSLSLSPPLFFRSSPSLHRYWQRPYIISHTHCLCLCFLSPSPPPPHPWSCYLLTLRNPPLSLPPFVCFTSVFCADQFMFILSQVLLCVLSPTLVPPVWYTVQYRVFRPLFSVPIPPWIGRLAGG